MVLGFISLLLTFGQTYIASVCIPEDFAFTMLPCKKRESKYKGIGPMGEPKVGGEHKAAGGEHKAAAEHHRRLLWNEHRRLGGGGAAAKCHEVCTVC